MSTHHLTTDVFTFRHKGRHVVYAPFRGLSFLCNDATANVLFQIQQGTYIQNGDEAELKLLKFLEEKGIINGNNEKPTFHQNEVMFQPTMVTLFLTNNCNLRCVYCYASSGDAVVRTMPWEMAKAAIDYVAHNAKETGHKQFSVGFHGGGEPLLCWSLFQRCVEYAKETAEKIGLRASCFSATNGVLSRRQVEWIAKHLDSLSISLDGPEDVQNAQRPLANGKASYAAVERTIKILDTHHFDYGIRSTITNLNVHQMSEMVEMFHERFATKQLHFEPLFVCGRCLHSKIAAPSYRVFMREFLKASKVAARYGMKVRYSGLRVDTITNAFCGACTDNFCVTPEGMVSSCYEVLVAGDPRSDLFFYGRYDPQTQNFDISDEKRRGLHALSVEKIPYCTNCIAKWHCAGDCPSKVSYESTVDGKRGSVRCLTNQYLTQRSILERMIIPAATQEATAAGAKAQLVESNEVPHAQRTL